MEDLGNSNWEKGGGGEACIQNIYVNQVNSYAYKYIYIYIYIYRKIDRQIDRQIDNVYNTYVYPN